MVVYQPATGKSLNFMRNVLLCVIFISLFVTACEKHDEILPVPPATPQSVPLAEPEPENIEEVKPAWNFTSELFQYGKFKGMPYRVLVPRNYDPTQNYPLHIFLHGIDERGTDNEQPLSAGAKNFQVDSVRTNYPAFIIFPQCPKEEYWFSEQVTNTLKGMIDAFAAENKIDQNKISIGGFSMGAYGTFAMVARYPGFFESAVAIAGDGDERSALSMAETSWQIFAGKKDDVVSSEASERMATALTKAGASVTFTLYPDADHHGTWRKAFATPDLFMKIFSADSK